MKSIVSTILMILLTFPTFGETEQDVKCPDKLKIAEEVIIECNDKVKELDGYIKLMTLKIKHQDEFIESQEKYIDELEDFAKDNDPNGFWRRYGPFIGFVGGVLFTTGTFIGIKWALK